MIKKQVLTVTLTALAIGTTLDLAGCGTSDAGGGQLDTWRRAGLRRSPARTQGRTPLRVSSLIRMGRSCLEYRVSATAATTTTVQKARPLTIIMTSGQPLPIPGPKYIMAFSF